MAKSSKARALGLAGEELVAKYLIDRGARILDRNWRIREGELDIVAADRDGTTIFVEVKTRTSAAFGEPLEAISGEKALRIQRLSLAWLATNGRLGEPFRIDVAGIIWSRSGQVEIDYREAIL